MSKARDSRQKVWHIKVWKYNEIRNMYCSIPLQIVCRFIYPSPYQTTLVTIDSVKSPTSVRVFGSEVAG